MKKKGHQDYLWGLACSWKKIKLQFNANFFSVSLDCGGKSGENLTYLEMAETSTPPHTNCEYTICKCQEKICRIRLDFEVICMNFWKKF